MKIPNQLETPSKIGSPFFIVGEGEAFQTIQSAIDQANLRGGGTVYLAPGTYYENLTLYPGITLEGRGIAALGFITIRGTHLLPESGELGFSQIFFTNDSSIFQPTISNGCPVLLFRSCLFEVKDGYAFAIPNLRGKIIFFDCCSMGKSNGFINNMKGNCEPTLFNTTIDSGEGSNAVLINSQALLFNVHVKARVEFSGKTSLATINGGCWLEDTIYVKNGASLKIACSSLETDNKSACFVDKESLLTLDSCSIESSAEEVIQGSGTVKIGHVSFPPKFKIASNIEILQTSDYAKITKKVGDKGDADPLPTNPVGYLVSNVNGCECLIPYYAKP